MAEQTKYCKGCDQTLPRSQFHKNGTTVHPECRTCRQSIRQKESNPRKEGSKCCFQCKITKLTEEFGSDKSQPDGLQSYCKDCRSENHIMRKNKKKVETKTVVKTVPKTETIKDTKSVPKTEQKLKQKINSKN